MKILCLRLSNLASIAGEHCIDFESQPLANAGLIAITGKTGAGKSTLLDAMCLALFDQIPRLNGALGSLTDVSGQDISIKDTKHILRRGAISGFSEVEFIALDQKGIGHDGIYVALIKTQWQPKSRPRCNLFRRQSCTDTEDFRM